MRTSRQAAWLLFAALLFSSYTLVTAQEPKKEDPAKKDNNGGKLKVPGGNGNGNGAPVRNVPTLPGFVYIPAGDVHPGGTFADYKRRHRGGERLKRALIYDVWGNLKPLSLPAFHIGRYEVTNAQWKLYLDRVYRVEHKCSGQETLEALVKRYVVFGERPLTSEWKAIYALNASQVMKAIQKQDKAKLAKDPKAKADWNPKWTLGDPNPDRKGAITRVFLPKDLKLVFYKHRTPSHWYGWSKLSGGRIGREYVDVRKAPADAFEVPKGEYFTELKLRDKNFASYPIRDLSANEIIAFCEWAGLHLPTEYEFERTVTGGRPNTDQHTFPGPWNHGVQFRLFAWQGNPACRHGPLAVDDPTVAAGDSAQKARHLLGNVWELTRTFYDLHPMVVPKPPDGPTSEDFNYALTAKGGSYGDGWPFIQKSTRASRFSHPIDLTQNNRADALGFRLVRHPVPGFDLMLHSILHLTYNKGRGIWGAGPASELTPVGFNLNHTGGVDVVHIAEDKAPYVHVKAKGAAIAVSPLWITKLSSEKMRSARKAWNSGKAVGNKYVVLGALRSDIPLRVGRKMSPKDAADTLKARADWVKRDEAFKKWEKINKRKKKKKRTDPPPAPGPKPPDPDRYEQATKRNEAKIGTWQEGILPPGQWFVVYWYGHIGLANKALVMPPDGLILISAKERKAKAFERKRVPTADSIVRLEPKEDRIHVQFSCEEQANAKKPELAPDMANSELWAWSEVHPTGWRRRGKPSKYSWIFRFTIPVTKEGLNNRKWNVTPTEKTPQKKTQKKTPQKKKAEKTAKDSK